MKDLIKKAEEIGFETIQFHLSDGDAKEWPNIMQYLWLCELQDWVGDKKGIYAYLDWANQECVIIDYKNQTGKELLRQDYYEYLPDWYTPNQILEALLSEALKLIKTPSNKKNVNNQQVK